MTYPYSNAASSFGWRSNQGYHSPAACLHMAHLRPYGTLPHFRCRRKRTLDPAQRDNALEPHQAPICRQRREIGNTGRTPPEWRARALAAAFLGAYHSRRARFRAAVDYVHFNPVKHGLVTPRATGRIPRFPAICDAGCCRGTGAEILPKMEQASASHSRDSRLSLRSSRATCYLLDEVERIAI
jgi:hypothetical protein